MLEVGGRAIVTRILAALAPLVDEQVILSNDDTLLNQPGARLVYDPTPHAGVLTALATGLDAAQGELCLAVACDMPFVSRSLFERLLDIQLRTGADVVIPRTSGFLEPMHALYRRQTVLGAIRAALGRGQQRMISYFGAVQVEEVDESAWQDLEPTGRAFFNVNTPEDLAEARRLAAAADTQPEQ